MRAVVESGFALVEVLVGMLVALIVALAMLGSLARVEGHKRNAVGAADVEQSGAIAAYALATEIANAGHGLAAAAGALATCPDTGSARTTLRPVPILIEPGADEDDADAFVASRGAAVALAGAIPLVGAAPTGAALRVRAATGFAAGDRIVIIGEDRCAATTAASVSAPDGDGIVTVTRADASTSWPEGTFVVDLGPDERVRRIRYDVVAGTLRGQDLTRPGATPNPIAPGIVHMKLQYGIDADGDGALDAWVPATAAWAPAAVLAAPATTLARIKAVRIGLVVRSDAPDPEVIAPYQWVLFDCAEVREEGCAGRVAGFAPAGWRYRTLETAIPLRNSIWNAAP